MISLKQLWFIPLKVKYGGINSPILKQQYDKMNRMIDLMKVAQMTPHRLSLQPIFIRIAVKVIKCWKNTSA